MLISVFVKIVNNEGPFHLQWYGGENEIICWHVKSACIRRFSGPYIPTFGPKKYGHFTRSVHRYVRDLYFRIIFLTVISRENTLTRLIICAFNFREFRNFFAFFAKIKLREKCQ